MSRGQPFLRVGGAVGSKALGARGRLPGVFTFFFFFVKTNIPKRKKKKKTVSVVGFYFNTASAGLGNPIFT